MSSVPSAGSVLPIPGLGIAQTGILTRGEEMGRPERGTWLTGHSAYFINTLRAGYLILSTLQMGKQPPGKGSAPTSSSQDEAESGRTQVQTTPLCCPSRKPGGKFPFLVASLPSAQELLLSPTSPKGLGVW